MAYHIIPQVCDNYKKNAIFFLCLNLSAMSAKVAGERNDGLWNKWDKGSKKKEWGGNREKRKSNGKKGKEI